MDNNFSSSQRTTRRRRDTTTNIREALGTILERLNVLEGRIEPSITQPPLQAPILLPTSDDSGVVEAAAQMHRAVSPILPSHTSIRESGTSVDVTDRIIGAISSLSRVRSNHFYISNFDPSVTDIDIWCEEVDRARELNEWDDNECLSRIAHCLKGDARNWLNDWVTNNRSWSNFKIEFKPLCSRRIDIAGILYEVMNTNSNQYPTYADYARRSLLRLKIVKGLSDELIVAIVIRGIVDAQIRAAAINANLLPQNLVNFLSIYTKSSSKIINDRITYESGRIGHREDRVEQKFRKRPYNSLNRHNIKCFVCGGVGHTKNFCSKRSRTETFTPSSSNNTVNTSFRKMNIICQYCKKPGHLIEDCFAKQRVDSENNKKSVNFCQELQGNYNDTDVTTAVIQGVPIDVLIDSGSCVSLITESVINHFHCTRVPKYQLLTGIGGQNVESLYYVTLVLQFCDISLEVDLLVVPSKCMNVPIIIGTDVLNRHGVTYIRTGSKQRLAHTLNVTQVFFARKNEIEIDTVLTDQDYETLMSIINKFSENLIIGTALSTVNTGEMVIRLTSDMPVNYRPYKLSQNEKIRMRAIVQDLLDKNIIRESNSDYASPAILVKKRDGSDRMCIDYRALNAITIKERFPLPLIDDHIDRLGQSKYFSCLDMATGFHQIRVSEENNSIKKTAFVTPEGHYEYLKMPYGLTNAPIVYQRIISKTLKRFIEEGSALVYVDDVIILASTITEALENLNKVMDTLVTAGFSINLKKSKFVATEVEYLGRRIKQGQVRPSAHKVQALVESPIPTNIKQVRQLLGLAGYFRRYIPNYALKTFCISRLTHKGVPFLWGSEQEEARKFIIDRLTNEPVLAIFNPELPTELHTDASSIGYGGILLQEHSDKKRHVVAYFSKNTQGSESRYHSYELETLAIVKALQKFRQYLIGIPFKIVTDCNAFKMTSQKKDLIPRVARWWMYMQDFNFSIEYRKGVLMSHADYLSRNPIRVNHITRPRNWAQIAQSADNETMTIIEQLNNNELDSRRYVFKNDTLYYNYNSKGEDSKLLCFIPKGHRLSLLRIFHDNHEHINSEKTLDLILRHFWFPGLRSFVRKYISHCLICLSSKKVPRAPRQPITSWTKPDLPFRIIHTDVLGPLPASNGYKYILIIVDSYSKYCLLYAMTKQDANELKRLFTHAVSLFGTPELIICDKGRMYESRDFKNLICSLGCNIHYITPEMHNENGQAERYCRTVLNMLRIESANKQNNWSDTLWKLQLVLNSTRQKTTQAAPLQLLVGIDAATPVIRSLIRDVAINNTQTNREGLREIRRQRASRLIDKNRRSQDRIVNKHRKITRVFNLNDCVFVSKGSQVAGKLDSGMRGPYRVVNVMPHGRYELKLLGQSYGKTTQAASENMVLWRGEWTPESCSIFFDSADQDLPEDFPGYDTQTATATLTNTESMVDGDIHVSGEAELEVLSSFPAE